MTTEHFSIVMTSHHEYHQINMIERNGIEKRTWRALIEIVVYLLHLLVIPAASLHERPRA